MTRLFLAAGLFFALAATPAPVVAAPSDEARPLIASYDFDWAGFRRYWSGFFLQTNGIVAIVLVVVGGGSLIIISARRRN